MAAAPGLIVRPARLTDAERIGLVHVQASREAYADLLPPAALAALDPAERAAMWRRQLTGGTARGLAVAEQAGVVVGFAACGRQRTQALAARGFSGEVTVIYVLNSAQGQGAGRLLMRAMARRLIAEGDRAMALWVLTANTQARDFYDRLSGAVVAERVDDRHEEVAYGWRDLAALALAA